MAKVIKYGDTSKIEGRGEQAPVGLYYARVESIEQKPSKAGDPQVELKWKITKDANGKKVKKEYALIWSYAPLDENASWARRLKELIEAFGLKAKGGNLGTIEGKEAMVRLREGTDLDGDYRPEISKVIKPKDADEGEEEPDDDDEEEEDDDDEDDEDDEEGAQEALAALNRTQLKELIKEEELKVTVRKSMSDDDLRAAIIAAGWEPEDDDDEEDDEEDDDEAEEDNYDDMSLAELRQELKDRELDTKGKKDVLIARLRTDDEEEPV